MADQLSLARLGVAFGGVTAAVMAIAALLVFGQVQNARADLDGARSVVIETR